ncbi:MAG: D-lactate dehydrogenase [Eubacteriales bacterium SKADARSKE-1]|nr:D-lactate dehydrogenase [Eubacteriales bacterium SKADARSKE-1]
MKIALFDTKPYDKEVFEKHNSYKNEMSFTFYETKLNEDTVSLSNGFDCVVVFVNDTLNSNVINQLYKYGVKLIALRCSGFNNVDVKEAFGKIHVVNVPNYSPYAVAEHTMALLLTSIRHIHKAYNRTRDYNFSLNGLKGFDLHGKTVGIIGTGRIGKVFANICNGFGMHVLAYDLCPDTSINVEYVSLENLFKHSDIISLHCPLTPENYHFINSKSIAKMKDGVILINTSRGSLVDTEDLLEEIKNKKVGATCLDVYEEESDIFFEDKSNHILQDDTLARLLSMPNVLITSHQAFLTEEALNNIAKTTINNIKNFFEDGIIKNEICYHCGRSAQCKKKRRERCF